MPNAKIGKRTLKSARQVHKWNNRYFYRCHRFALEGLSDTQIAALLQVSPAVFAAWKKKKPSLQDALKEAREERKGMKNGLSGYIFDRLSPEARDIWDRLVVAWEDEDKSAKERKLRDLLDGTNDTVLKALFLHAVAFTRFNPSEAMKMVGITKGQVKRWAQEDRAFLEALDEIEEHKKNWYEGKLTKLVDEEDPAAVLFVNRTYNADRGYSPKQQVTVSSTVNHVHSGQVTLDTLSPYLDVDTLEKLHHAVQTLRAVQAKGPVVKQLEALPGGDLEDRAIVDGEVVTEGDNADG